MRLNSLANSTVLCKEPKWVFQCRHFVETLNLFVGSQMWEFQQLFSFFPPVWGIQYDNIHCKHFALVFQVLFGVDFRLNGAVYSNYRARASEAVPVGFCQTVRQSEGRKRQNVGVASLSSPHHFWFVCVVYNEYSILVHQYSCAVHGKELGLTVDWLYKLVPMAEST